MLGQLGERARVLIEVPRGSFVKRMADGRVDFVSPLPCPYNYGRIPAVTAADGDALDALVLGRRLALGTAIVVPVQGVVRFVDAGIDDPKVVCGAAPLTRSQRRGIERFFRAYCWLKRGIARVRGTPGPTAFEGWVPWSEGP